LTRRSRLSVDIAATLARWSAGPRARKRRVRLPLYAARNNSHKAQRKEARITGSRSTSGTEDFMELSEKHREYWRKNLTVTLILLVIWFVVTFVVGYIARDLQFNFFGWTFAFWMGAQGSLAIYVIIIWFYARYMNRLDQQYDVAEGEE
jgi:putative solute:sodium symporter small subunit